MSNTVKRRKKKKRKEKAAYHTTEEKKYIIYSSNFTKDNLIISKKEEKKENKIIKTWHTHTHTRSSHIYCVKVNDELVKLIWIHLVVVSVAYNRLTSAYKHASTFHCCSFFFFLFLKVWFLSNLKQRIVFKIHFYLIAVHSILRMSYI